MIATVCILILLILAALLGVYIYRKRHKLAKHLDRHLRRRRSGQDPTNLYIGQSSHNHGKSWKNLVIDTKSWKRKIESILKRSWKSPGIGLLFITNHAREFRKFHIYRPTVLVILLWQAFGLCSRFQIVMVGRRKTCRIYVM